jgi:hypothetical protein
MPQGRMGCWPNYRYYPETGLEGLREATQTLVKTVYVWSDFTQILASALEVYIHFQDSWFGTSDGHCYLIRVLSGSWSH